MDTFSYPLTFSAVGLAIVFAVLTLIASIIHVLRKFDDRWEQQESQTELDRLDKEPSIDNTTLVLITAAVATVVTGRHRIRSVRRVAPAGTRHGSWTLAGRAVHHGSHTVKPHSHR